MLQLISNWLSAAIGAGLIVALIDWFRTSRRDRAERRLSLLSDQIEHLYGPINYLITTNKGFFDMSRQIQAAGDKAFSGKVYAPSATAAVSKMMDDTIETSNQYINLVIDNNEKIKQILDEYIHLASVDDVTQISVFVRDYYSLRIETNRLTNRTEPKEEPRLPLQVVMELPRISFLDPKFISFVETRYKAIKAQFQKHL